MSVVSKPVKSALFNTTCAELLMIPLGIDDISLKLIYEEITDDKHITELHVTLIKEFLNAELARKNTEYENLQQQNLKRDKELEERQEQLRNEFKVLANTILEDKSKKFTEMLQSLLTNIYFF